MYWNRRHHVGDYCGLDVVGDHSSVYMAIQLTLSKLRDHHSLSHLRLLQSSPLLRSITTGTMADVLGGSLDHSTSRVVDCVHHRVVCGLLASKANS